MQNEVGKITATRTGNGQPFLDIVEKLIQKNPGLLSLPFRGSCGASDITYTSLIVTERKDSERDQLNTMVSDRFVMLISTAEIIVLAAQSSGVNAYNIFFPVSTDRLTTFHDGMDVIEQLVNRWSDIPFHYLDYAWDRALGSGLLEQLTKQFETYHPRAFEEVDIIGNKVSGAVQELFHMYAKSVVVSPPNRAPMSNTKPKQSVTADERPWILVGVGALAAVAAFNLFKAK